MILIKLSRVVQTASPILVEINIFGGGYCMVLYDKKFVYLIFNIEKSLII